MPRFCGVIKCSNRESRDKKRFFRVPAALKAGNEIKQVLSSRRRSKWIVALRRADLTETKLKYLWICEDHFISGKPASLLDSDDPDWVPSQLMGYEIDKSNAEEEQWQENKVDDEKSSDQPNDSISFGQYLMTMDLSNSALIQSLKRKTENEPSIEPNKQIRRKETPGYILPNAINCDIKEAHFEQKCASKEVQTDLTMDDIQSLLWASHEFLRKSVTFKEKLKEV